MPGSLSQVLSVTELSQWREIPSVPYSKPACKEYPPIGSRLALCGGAVLILSCLLECERLSVKDQRFSNSSAHENHLESLLKLRLPALPWSFWFCRSELGPENLHFYHISRRSHAAGLGPHLENFCERPIASLDLSARHSVICQG